MTEAIERPTVRTLSDGRRIRGAVDQGFGAVLDAFVANFEERHDLGAACTVYVDGRAAVDLWGGIADRRTGRAWDARTTAVIFSCSKGVLAICAYLLVQDGRLDLDAPIARYWPEFAKAGKAAITVRQAMSHRAGLAALDRDLSKADVLAWDPVIRAIEGQRPHHGPDDGHLYHALTYGWLVGEVIRRVTGQTPGTYFRDAIGERLALRTWIGLPVEERSSVAHMAAPLPDEDSAEAREAARLASESPIVARSLSMGGAFVFPADGDDVTFNDPAIQAAEIPAANGISTAESLARLYAACVSPLAGPPILTPASIDDALLVRSSGPQLSGLPDDGARWGTGFQLASPPTQPMLGRRSFGHAGAGGQLAFGDAEHRAGFAYLSDQMGGYGDARARELSRAVRTVLTS
ncbi:MAG TPA: serine hydrolase domain-containing protein [Candidatus Limnocylindrales bacterium]|nr:serine hydrolase domain-containing protein [Candidatus Limnocylindrales bacterium]